VWASEPVCDDMERRQILASAGTRTPPPRRGTVPSPPMYMLNCTLSFTDRKRSRAVVTCRVAPDGVIAYCCITVTDSFYCLLLLLRYWPRLEEDIPEVFTCVLWERDGTQAWQRQCGAAESDGHLHRWEAVASRVISWERRAQPAAAERRTR
jgi:hypothetical protein